jgi:hypothetical protein
VNKTRHAGPHDRVEPDVRLDARPNLLHCSFEDGRRNAPPPTRDRGMFPLTMSGGVSKHRFVSFVFWVLAVAMVGDVFVVLLMKRSVAEKGARIGSE